MIRRPALLLAVVSALASAKEPEPEPAPLAPPEQYSLPWQLRTTRAVTEVRSDTSFALSATDVSGNMLTTASTLNLSYQLTESLAPLVRLAFVNHNPQFGLGGVAVVNPVVGATWSHVFSPQLRMAAFLGLSIPIGMGGGDTPDLGQAIAARSGIYARAAMDNALFEVNDVTVTPGLGVSYVSHGFTAQLEVTLLQHIRARGDALQPDATRTNLTSGLHLGYFLLPQLSLGGELRYQRWLSTPTSVTERPSSRETFTGAIGIRGHFQVSDGHWIHPGLAYTRGFDQPMSASDYSIMQLDVPWNF